MIKILKCYVCVHLSATCSFCSQTEVICTLHLNLMHKAMKYLRLSNASLPSLL
jgi:hypothetical protein